MLKIKATDLQMKQMAANAANASHAVGMGALHFRPGDRFTPIDFKVEEGHNPGLFLDYVEGRMVKFSAWKKEDHWEVREKLDPEYQSWIRKYPTWEALAKTAGASIVP